MCVYPVYILVAIIGSAEYCLPAPLSHTSEQCACICVCSVVEWCVAKDISAFEAILRLDERVGHPVRVVLLSVSKGGHADVLAHEAAQERG